MVQDSPEGALISVWAKPRASKSRIIGRRDDGKGQTQLEVALAAPPVDGAANQELLEFIARSLKVGKSRVELVRGESSRLKVVRISGIQAQEVVKALGL
jgi:uncharacterized protein